MLEVTGRASAILKVIGAGLRGVSDVQGEERGISDVQGDGRGEERQP